MKPEQAVDRAWELIEGAIGGQQPIDTIGEGCKCLYGFDKRIILRALEKQEVEAIETLERAKKEKESPLAESIIEMMPSTIAALETVSKRVRELPDCESLKRVGGQMEIGGQVPTIALTKEEQRKRLEQQLDRVKFDAQQIKRQMEDIIARIEKGLMVTTADTLGSRASALDEDIGRAIAHNEILVRLQE